MAFRNYLKDELKGQIKNLSTPKIKEQLAEVGVYSTMNSQRKQEFKVKHKDLLEGFRKKFKALRQEAEVEKAKTEVELLREQL